MNNNIEPSVLLQIFLNIKDILIGIIGGLVGYLLKYRTEKEKDSDYLFSFSMLIINIILGGFTAYLFGSLIEPNNHYRDFIIGSVGVASYPIMSFIESKAITVIINIISKNTNIDKKDLK